VNPKLRNSVRIRANESCEYCQLRQRDTTLPHEVDHIRARKHRGRSQAENQAYACAYCNAAKGPNVAGHDPITDELVALFNPRMQNGTNIFGSAAPFSKEELLLVAQQSMCSALMLRNESNIVSF